MIGEVVATFRAQVARKGQRLVVRTAKALLTVWGDADRLTGVLTNLVSNAHKYTPPGGRITVAARRERS